MIINIVNIVSMLSVKPKYDTIFYRPHVWAFAWCKWYRLFIKRWKDTFNKNYSGFGWFGICEVV